MTDLTKGDGDVAWLSLRQVARKVFLEDWLMKAMALVITLGLWYGVTGLSTPVEQEFSPQLNINIPNDTEITNDRPTDIQVRISGDKRKMDQINRSDLTAILDLTDMKPSDQVITLSPDNIRIIPPLATGLKLVSVVRPTRIAINLESVEDKDVDINIQTTGAPPSGYEIYSMTAIPAKSRVRGPSSALRSFDHVDTEKIDLTGRTQDFTATQVRVSASSTKINVLNTVVDVIVRIGEKRTERGFYVPISGTSGKSASFTVYGPISVVSKIHREAFHVTLQKGENGVDLPQVVVPPELEGSVEIRDLKIR